MLNTNVINLRQSIQNYRFIIPNYQRPYSWEEEQVQALWNDIRDAWLVRSNESVDFDQRNHFLGSILTTNYPGQQETLLNVVDGQQRLTSLTIFAAALLDICVQHNVGSPIFSSIFSTNPRPFITINEGNDYFFATIIEPSRAENSREARKVAFDRTTADSDVHNRIRTNYYEIYRLISLYLQDIPHNKKGFQLGGILETFLDYLYIVRIHVPNNANIIRIFRTLNERGVDLSQGDITKSIIFESVLNNNSALAQVSLLWQETFDQIDSEGSDNLITEYLRHYHISTRSYIAEGKLSTEIERYLVQERSVANTPTAVDLMRRLKDEAGYYNVLLQSDHKSSETNEIITIIRDYIDITASFPALLAAFTRWNNHPVTLNRFLRLTEHFIFRYFHIQGNKSVEALEKFMSTVAKHIRTNAEPLEQIKSWYKERSPDASFANNFMTASVRKAQLAKYIYWKLEQSTHLKLVNVMSKEYKINGIMPAKANSFYTRVEIDQDYVKRIGNQLLWPTKLFLNKQLQTLIGQPHSLLTVNYTTAKQALDTNKQWGTAAIDTRQALLTERAKAVWSLDI